jgi:predicted nucleotidyltransferase
MLPQIEAHRAEIAELRRRFGVQRLEVSGSAARVWDFDPARSDVGLLVTFDRARPLDLGAYFDLNDELSALLAYKVDLVMAGAVRNPIVASDIDRWKQPVFGLKPELTRRAGTAKPLTSWA